MALPDDSNVNTKETEKTTQVQRPGDRGQQDVESGDKIVPVIVGALGTIKKGLDQKLQLLPGHPLAIELQKGHTNEHCTQHSVSAGVNRCDMLLRSGLTRRLPPDSQQARISLKM